MRAILAQPPFDPPPPPPALRAGQAAPRRRRPDHRSAWRASSAPVSPSGSSRSSRCSTLLVLVRATTAPSTRSIGGFYMRPGGPPLGDLRIDGTRSSERSPSTRPGASCRACVHADGRHGRAGPAEAIYRPSPAATSCRPGRCWCADGEIADPSPASTPRASRPAPASSTPTSAPAATRGPRSAWPDGDLMAVVCDGRADDDAGMTMAELAETMVGLGAARGDQPRRRRFGLAGLRRPAASTRRARSTARSCAAAARSPRALRTFEPRPAVGPRGLIWTAALASVWMPWTPRKVLMGIYFYPRGGSAHVCRALAQRVRAQRLRRHRALRLALRPRRARDARRPSTRGSTCGPSTSPRRCARRPRSASTAPPARRRCTAPTRTGPAPEDPMLASLDDERLRAPGRGLGPRAGDGRRGGDADRLYLHHLTPLNEAAARVLPGDADDRPHPRHRAADARADRRRAAPPSWTRPRVWARAAPRLGRRTASVIVVSGDERARARAAAAARPRPRALRRASPTASTPTFAPRQVDRDAHWRRNLVERPAGVEAGLGARQRRLRGGAIWQPLAGTVLLYVGRFTAVKRLPVLIEAFADRPRPLRRHEASLVLLGGYPGEWEGEHPDETIERLGCPRRLPRRLARPRASCPTS